MLKNIVAKIQVAIRKAVAAFSPVVAVGVGGAPEVGGAPKMLLMAGCCFAAVLLAGCAPRHVDALMIVAPKDGGKAFQSVVQVPDKMDQGSSEVVIDIENDVYRGKMVCTRGGFEGEFETASGLVGWGWMYSEEWTGVGVAGRGSGKTVNLLSVCRAALISGDQLMQCELSGGPENVTGNEKKFVRNLLLIPTFGFSRFIPDDYVPLGTGECRKSDGTAYVVQIVEPPGGE